MTKQKPDSAAGAPSTGAPAAVSSKAATDLTAACEKLLSGSRHLDSAALRDALLDLHDFWLSTKAAEIGVTATSGFAIVATGGLGRRELLPYSDLDLMLLHDNLPKKIVSEVAENLWYPLWDANIRLDHSVRTVAEAMKVAAEDISAGLAMLEVRHIAGDADLSSLLVGGARRQWRTGIASRFDELVEHTQQRWQRSGQIAHRAEPDLKTGRGGLRDVQLLNALAIAQLADVYPSRSLASPTETLGEAHLALLNVRTELHRVSGRGRELLLAQHADEIGAALRIGDRFDLARTLSDAARTVSFYVDAGLRTAANALPRRGFAAFRRPVRRPLDEGVIEFGGEVILARDARPERDPGLILRVAAASATTGLPMAASTLGPARRSRTRTAHTVAAAGAQGPAGDAGRGTDGGGHHRGARPHRAVGQALPGVGRGARPAAARCRAHLDRRPPSRRNRLAGKRIHHPGVPAGPAVARRAVPRHRQGPRRRPQRHRGRTRHADRHPARAVAVGHRSAVQGGAPPPAAAAHRDAPRPAGREDHRSGGRRAGRRHRPAGAAARAGRGRFAGHRSRRVGRLEGVADRRPGAALSAGDGR